jgi:hypothetical protein
VIKHTVIGVLAYLMTYLGLYYLSGPLAERSGYNYGTQLRLENGESEWMSNLVECLKDVRTRSYIFIRQQDMYLDGCYAAVKEKSI